MGTGNWFARNHAGDTGYKRWACKLYENCGFKLKGFDSFLYKAIEGVQDEVVLYWYYRFDEN